MGREQSTEPAKATRRPKARGEMRRFLTRCGAILAGAVIVMGISVAGPASPASAATPAGTLDQSSESWDGASFREPSDGTYQVFTAGVSGVFTGAEINRQTCCGSNFYGGAIDVSVVTVANGWPTTTVLGSGRLPETTTAGWHATSFTTTFTVTAGQQYALKLTPQSTVSIAAGGGYPGGYEIDHGIRREYSLAFRTYVDTTRVPPLLTAASPSSTGTVGTPYPTYTFTASGAPAPTFTVASGSLPSGLTLDSTTGQLTGTPAHAGAATFTVRAANGIDPPATSAPQTITIGRAAQTVTITSPAPAHPAAGSTYHVSATGGASGNPVTFTTPTSARCSVTGATVSLIRVGECVINADQAGNDDYLPGTAVQTISIVAGPAATLSITPTNRTVTQGDAIAFAITGADAAGNTVDTTGAILTSSGPDTIGGHRIQFSGAGDHVVTAALDGVSTSTTVRVVAGPLATLALSPATATVVEGGTTAFTVTGADAAGNPVDVGDATLTASPRDAVDGHAITFSGAGVHTVTATVNGVSTTAKITVTAGPLRALTITPTAQTVTQGDTIGFTITGTDVAGNPVDTTAAVFSSSARADTITGTSVTFSGAGDHTVTATLDGVSTSARIRVVAGPLATLTVTPATATVTQGNTTVFTITGADAAGNPVNVDAAALSSTARADAIDGRAVTFSGAGTRTVTASLGHVTATADIEVTPGPVATLTLTPAAATVTQGGKVEFTIAAADSAGNPVDTSSGTLASMNTADTIQGRTITFSGAGTRTITAVLGGVTATATVEVVAGPAATLTITPSATTIDQGGTLAFIVTGADTAGNPVDTGAAVLTSSIGTDIIDGTTVTFPHTSPHVITATLGTLTATVTVDVIPAAVPSSAAVVPSPPAASAPGLATTGLDGGALGATGIGALVLLLAGAALLLARRSPARQRPRP
ncbi:hypothetical protein GCM10010462_25220 [Microbacterium dextranolyticum]|uniref:BIG2 domain-containing protein n=2 Tax=Microbacterium dextranolyticum TaxID=36806 RepID=A0A9W6HQ72_9MICO|nr:hypothetical protein GCM10017591_26420 [Microbacterium dextranolyticum]